MIRRKLITQYWSQSSSAFKEFILITVIAILTFIVATKFDLFERLLEWSRQHENVEVDELITLSALLIVAVGIFSYRRWKELQRESRKREHVERMLRKAHDGLEQRIQKRTTELMEANRALEQQIVVRQKTEQHLEKYRAHLEDLVAERTSKLEMEIAEHHRTEQQLQVSLKEKEMLLKEVHHRVKNNLQIISSLLNLQASLLTDESSCSIFSESRQRVKTMALIHEKLYQSQSLREINCQEYVRSLASELYTSYQALSGAVELVLDVAGIHLGLDTAIPCGLILTGLLSNAFKYGVSSGNGTIRVVFSATSEHHYELRIIDNGAGLSSEIDLDMLDSLGLQLVKGLVEEQLEGSLKLLPPPGTTWVIRFPQNAPQRGADRHFNRQR